ncbi:hypothetical protein OR263_37715 [Streptomyces sp. NEAU-H22]|uniref:hypothetical protein n=1 Tax=unclassified Streptomyces TaxID=2593676 RepID=UPI002252E8C5|nr:MULTISPECIES: hypothetical protein [unclassified Streptomyces]MCX3292373.1 hypothetical protein [Streptomyces sp. NEAU-H22]WMD04141.1 hypothetical protein Q7C01_06930 [Streptomyces sp. FXY-T5]
MIGEVLEQELPEPAPPQPLPSSQFNQMVEEISEWDLSKLGVLDKFRAAHPLLWLGLTESHLESFAFGVCYGRPDLAGRNLAAALPGVQLVDAPLLTEAVALVPKYCQVTNPAALDTVSNELTAAAVRNTLTAPQPPSTALPPVVPEVPHSLKRAYGMACTSLGDEAKSLATKMKSRPGFAGLIGAGATVVASGLGLGCKFAVSEVISELRSR